MRTTRLWDNRALYKRGLELGKKHTDLAQIFLTPLMNHQRSFLKFVGSGTGLGKTYGSFSAYAQYINEVTDNDGGPVVGIFAAPQHNQISFKESIKKKLEANGCSVLKVEPTTAEYLSNIEKDPNAYDIAKKLFFYSDGKLSNLYKSILKAAKATDKKLINENDDRASSLEKTLSSITYNIHKVDRLSGNVSTYDIPSNDSPESVEDEIYRQDMAEEVANIKYRLKEAAKTLAKKILYLFKAYYEKGLFRKHVKEFCTNAEIKKFREQSASFFPFLEYQASGDAHVLLGMTVSKMLVKHMIFRPRYIKSKNILTWRTDRVDIHDILSDKSDLLADVRSELEEAREAGIDTNQCGEIKLFDAEFILYIDESDESKRTIKKEISQNKDDDGVVQAIGAVAKEAGDVLYDLEFKPLLEQIPEADRDLFAFLSSGENDDHMKRRVGKEILRRIQDVIIDNMIENNTGLVKEAHENSEGMIRNIRKLAMATLRAPYCTVDDSIDRKVFDTTSVFGGEAFGFIGSRSVNDLVVVLKRNSLCITRKESSPAGYSHVPLSDFFALITISWFIFRSLLKHRGERPLPSNGDKKQSSFDTKLLDIKQAAAFAEGNSVELVTALKGLINSVHKQSTGALSAVSAPFKVVSISDSANESGNYHTTAAHHSMRGAYKITRSFFSGAFSPSEADIDNIIGENAEHFATSLESPVDTYYSHEKGHTIYGMVQGENLDYEIDLDQKTHVFFPVKIRKSSAEGFLSSLLDNHHRRISCFLMSATGAFRNSHIPAWSMSTLEALSKTKGFDVIPMSHEDYALTLTKQTERGELKDIHFNDMSTIGGDGFSSQVFHKARRIVDQLIAQESDSPLAYNLKILLDHPHKRREAENILKSLHSAHTQDKATPTYTLTLAQTHSRVTYLFNMLSGGWLHGFEANGSHYTMECLLNSGKSSIDSGGGAGYGIYLLKSSSMPTSRFGSSKSDRPTLVICYSAGLDKELTNVFKKSVSNPHDPAYKIKQMLNMPPKAPLRDIHSSDFSVMDYILNDHVDHNVMVVSAYASAARGVNFIVNKDTAFLQSLRRKMKKESPKNGKSEERQQQSLFDDNDEQPQRKDVGKLTERDMDALFIAAPPFYSEVRTDISDSLKSEAAQSRFFHQCDMFFYYVEWLAAKGDKSGEYLRNTDVDLQSVYDDASSDKYFDSQHSISLMSLLMQGMGRLERTNSQQKQHVFYCSEAAEVIRNGADAIADGLSDQEIEETINSMSVINKEIFRKVMNGGFKRDEKRNTGGNSVIDKSSRFESLKTTFLDAIRQYRGFEVRDDIPADITLQIEFYEAFRSSLIFTEGYSAYINSLDDIVSRMPRHLKRKYRQIVDMMFESFDGPIVEYRGNNNRVIDLKSEYRALSGVSYNPFEIVEGGKYIYPSAWYLHDLMGNYGEFKIQSAINELMRLEELNQLNHKTSEVARRCYELGDFFLERDGKLVVIDSKHYRARFSFVTSSHNDRRQNDRLINSAHRKLQEIKRISGYDHVSYIVINVASRHEGTSGSLKKLCPDCYSMTANSDEVAINNSIVNLFYNMRRG